MKKIIINENQMGFMFKNGKYIKLLSAGKYHLLGGRDIHVVQLDEAIACPQCSLDVLLADENVAKRVSVVEVSDEQLALHFVNGKFSSVIRKGKHAFWSACGNHEFKLVDTSGPDVGADIPEYVFSNIPAIFYTKVQVAEYQKALLYFDCKLVRILDGGAYYFWKNSTSVDVQHVDMRLTQMNVTGQEMLTADKVTLRINFVCSYRITDCVKALTEIDDFKEQLHVSSQLALREYVGKHKLDDILENKDMMSQFVFEKLKEKEKALFIEIFAADVKDIILPGEIRDIMNTVLIAEKRAQANVITRREEVASTRSLLNTARLMDENKTLYKLKELEYMERICENVGNISLHGNGSILSQLADMLSGN